LRIAELTPRGRRRAIGVDIAEGSAPGATGRTPGPLLVLTRNQPTDVTVINGLAEATSIHWHGLELESHSDGVAGWSGDADHIAPPIPAGGTFVAHLSQPRAGTFIYHTHLHDLKQLTAGLYGAIVVLPEGQTFDAAHDHVFVLGWNGTRARPPNFVLNGDSTPAPLVLASGVAHRLRFVGIGAAGRLRIAVRADSAVARWRPISTDGADLAPARAVAGPATTVLTAGSTLDVEFLPPAPGTYRLTIGPAASGAPILITQQLVVR
jgi:FtsP/CotA-like multicopper oxidase with cupredoxin domain